MSPEEYLANAIILQAVDDYREVLAKYNKGRHTNSVMHDKNSLERFFRSKEFMALSSADGEMILRYLQKEAENEGKSARTFKEHADKDEAYKLSKGKEKKDPPASAGGPAFFFSSFCAAPA